MAGQRFVVVGGGTAGWLAALMIGDAARRAKLDLALTVVESSAIPTIGVGEGTTAVFRQMLRHFGFDEAEFLRETEATIKFGILHRDWRRKGEQYWGPIDDPHLVAPGPNSWIDVSSVAAGRSVADAHLFRWLMARNKAPVALKAGRQVPLGPFHHAYHFDQARVGRWLRSKATEVATVDAEVKGLRRDEAGDIAALVTDQGEIEGDFFIDCTGFRKALIGEMGGVWTDFSDMLPVNRAMPFWLEHEDGQPIPPYTLSQALNAGWMWQIPTQARMGCGYVYSDANTTPEAAKAEVEALLGRSIEPRNDLKFGIGRLDRVWIGNCLALGLSSSFFEPLEATSIHGTIVQLMIFTGFHLKAAMTAKDRDAYNAAIGRQVDDFRDFINLHYAGGRDDTPFWRDVAATRIGQPTRDRLALWATKMPGHEDFRPFPGRFAHVEEQLYYPVLDGLGLLDRGLAKAALARAPKVRAEARKRLEALTREYRIAAGQALDHRSYLNRLHEEPVA